MALNGFHTCIDVFSFLQGECIVYFLILLNVCLLISVCLCVRSVTRSYYRGAAGALLVYDITRYRTM